MSTIVIVGAIVIATVHTNAITTQVSLRKCTIITNKITDTE